MTNAHTDAHATVWLWQAGNFSGVCSDEKSAMRHAESSLASVGGEMSALVESAYFILLADTDDEGSRYNRTGLKWLLAPDGAGKLAWFEVFPGAARVSYAQGVTASSA